jgi:hypothetical protein
MTNETPIEGAENPQINGSNEKNSSSNESPLTESQIKTPEISEKIENIPAAPLTSQPPKKQLSEKQLKALEKGRKKLEDLRKRNRKKNKRVNKIEKEDHVTKNKENNENKEDDSSNKSIASEEDESMVNKKNNNKSDEDKGNEEDKENKTIIIERQNDGYILLFLIGIIAIGAFFLFRYLRNRSQNNTYESYVPEENEETNIRVDRRAPVTSSGAFPVFEDRNGD